MNEKRKRRSRSMKELYPCSGCEWATDPLKIPRIFAMRMRRVDVSLYRAESLSLSLSSSRFPASHSFSVSLSLSLPLLFSFILPFVPCIHPPFTPPTGASLSPPSLSSFFTPSPRQTTAPDYCLFPSRATLSCSYFRPNFFAVNCPSLTKR